MIVKKRIQNSKTSKINTILIQYQYCDLDPEKEGCKPGSRPECLNIKRGVNCQYFRYRKEE